MKNDGTYVEVIAGGGLVRNSSGEFLLIHRNGRWDLPKGMQEPGEEISACALREVSEETGLDCLVLGSFICETTHTYSIYGPLCRKHVFWYNMEYQGESLPVPQTEEGITEVKWVKKECLPEYLEGTYDSIRQVFVSEGLL